MTEALIGAIRTQLPELRLLTDPTDRESYRSDETAYLVTGLPCGVALPTETRQVAELVRLAGEFRVPIVPRGAGTGLSGGAAGIEGGLTIAFTAMDRILEIDADNLVVVTQPGIINAALKAAVAAQGLFYAPDPASYEICSIGGNLGTNAGGLCCIKYGQTRESVLGLEVVMADGTVLRTGGKNVKDVAGYSLTHLMVGSQGTLGLITEAILRLRPTPPPRLTLLAFFERLEASGDAVAGIAQAGLSPVTLELLDAFTIAAVDEVYDLGLDREAAAMLMIESDLPGDAARGGDGRRPDRVRGGRCHERRPCRRCPGGRLAAPGPTRGVPRAGAARDGADGGRRGAPFPGARAARRDRRDRRGLRGPLRDVRPCGGRQPASELRVRP